ncbi:Ger(x)C family spore germination protein [Paenibacillus radicis (ex Gao et al. 2016)]|uniref:Spore germination protein YfkR n=1 Tax=Paenibacillus radicis (ex Gao et al. 2016) TaxID=1737354 RepID=A0A917HPJ8_9BACL|nr:Ger(x)C family spore germination protein [Paenibacillus radicis (ex Gao et al. 2016)]GGG84965.1 putative spore germination protein YfkR [Paenibacillus radicis (ex Gao et al. 2016)]
MTGSIRWAGNKKRIAATLAILLLIVSVLSGCWDLRYLDRLGVVMAVGVDSDPTGKQQLRVTMQTVLAQNAAAGNKLASEGMAVTTFTETGDTMFEAIRKMTRKTSRRLFFSHTRLLIIGEQAARKGVFPLLDLIERNPDIRGDIAVMIARNTTAEQLLQTTTQIDAIPANQMYDTLEINEHALGQEYLVRVQEITRMALQKKQQVAIPSITLEGDEAAGNDEQNLKRIHPTVQPELSTMAVLKEGHLKGFLTAKESRGLSWMLGRVKSTVVKAACPNSEGYFMVEISGSKVNMSAVKPKDGIPVIQIGIKPEGSVKEVMCSDLPVDEEEMLKEIGKLIDQSIEGEIEAVIVKLQKKMQLDTFGWGRLIYMQKPALWRRIDKEWDVVYPKVQHELKIKTRIKDTGVRGNSIVK